MQLLKSCSYFILALSFITLMGCKGNEDLSPIPEWETGVHGYIKYASGSSQDFIYTAGNNLNFDFQWISLDKKNTVTKVEFYVLFSDTYIATDNTRRTARIGGSSGRLLKTIEGADVRGNRENMSLSFSQEDIYNLYADATFDYGYNGAEPVFNSTTDNNALRVQGSRFIPGDAFRLRWVLTTADGRVFNQWSDGICAEYESYHAEDGTPNDGGFNCTVDFSVKCESNIGGTLDYVQTNMAGGGTPEAGSITGTVTWEPVLDAEGNVVPGSYTTSDASFGLFDFVYGDDPSTGLTVNDACNVLSLSGADQYGDTYTYTIVSINGPEMVINWSNTYDDSGTVTLTRQDGANWPPLSN